MLKKILFWTLIFIIPTITFANSLNEKIVKLWGNNLWNIVIKQCDNYSKYPEHCKKINSAIASAESNFGRNAHNYNIYWNSKYKFKSFEQSIIQFNKTYNKYYWKPNYKPSDFYSNTPNRKPRTRYCMSEHSSNSSNYCPNWFKHSWNTFNYLSK